MGGLKRVDTNMTIERGCSQEVGIPGTPGGLEGPVIGSRKFANDLTGLRVPAERPVVFAAR